MTALTWWFSSRGDPLARRLLTFILLDLVGTLVVWRESMLSHLRSQILWDPMAASACLTTWFVYLAMRGPRLELLAVTSIGTGLEVLLLLYRGPQTLLDRVLHVGPGLGAAATVGFIWRICASRTRQDVLDHFAVALCMPLFYLVGTFSFFNAPPPQVYDLYAYAIDGGGLAPSFLVARMVEHTPFVHALMYAVYYELPLLMIIARQYSRRCRAGYTDPLIVFFVLGVVGCEIYKLCPMVGMRVLVGHAYPDVLPPVMVGPPHPVPAPGAFPRNCMPSLHLSWALAAFWSVCRASRPGRWISLCLVLLTVIAARAIGDHYWIDFVAAFPFTVAVQGLCARASQTNRTERQVAVVAGSALTALVLIGLLEFPMALLRYPALTDLAAVCIIVSAILMERSLGSASSQRAEGGNPSPAREAKPTE